MTSKKNVCTLILGAIFGISKHIQRFCDRFHTVCPNFHRFYPGFYQIKRFGGAVALPPPTPVFDKTLLQLPFAIVNCSDVVMSVFYSPV